VKRPLVKVASMYQIVGVLGVEIWERRRRRTVKRR
jgi:hypothetical protein